MSRDDYPVKLPATYKNEWDDGFGARGWKLDATVDDPMVIASTAASGDRIPTSVFVHDILDHHLCGLPLSGHRNEAIALTLLGQRTGVSPLPDFAQMTEEDILHGKVNGESMQTFLPEDLLQQGPPKYHNDSKLLIGYLLGKLGEAQLTQRLVDNFSAIGLQGLPRATNAWRKTGLAFNRRRDMGLCIQQILQAADKALLAADVSRVHGVFMLSADRCALQSDFSQPLYCYTY